MVCLFVKGLQKILVSLPLDVTLFLARRVGDLAYFLHKRKWVGYAQLRAVFGNKYSGRQRKRILRRSYQSLAMTFAEFLVYPSLSKEEIRDRMETSNLFDADRGLKVFGRKKGGIFLTAHLDSWEFPAVFSANEGHVCSIIAKEQKNKELDNLLNQFRTFNGNEVVLKGSQTREVFRILKEGRYIATAGDQSGTKADLYFPFFGRKTATPTGSFRVVQKVKSSIISVFMKRLPNGKHVCWTDEPIFFDESNQGEEALADAVKKYLSGLEQKIRENPEQWLWGHKRWKHCLTQKILILSDGKEGHFKQSRAIAENLKEVISNKRPIEGQSYEFEVEELLVQFRSSFHRKIFTIFFPFFSFFSRGRLSVLKLFIPSETVRRLDDVYSDYIISCGSSLTPLNLLLKKENQSKNIHLMSPPFPFNLFSYDLKILPKHDGYDYETLQMTQTILAPSIMNHDDIQKKSDALLDQFPVLKGKKRICLLFGGDMKNYKMDYGKVEDFLFRLNSFMQAYDHKLILSNSRRTPEEILELLKKMFYRKSICPVFCDVNDPDQQYPYLGMIGASDFVIVTEESVSMISESIEMKKPVYLLRTSHSQLPEKHRKFQEKLIELGVVQILNPNMIHHQLKQVYNVQNVQKLRLEQKQKLELSLANLL